jgi:hypothetical protein
MTSFQPECRAVLIGSLPLAEHREAVELILDHTPDFPLWPQLPRNPKEGMVRQFLTGMPGLMDEDNRFWIDNGKDDFETEMVSFYEEYMAAVTDDDVLDNSRFALGMDTAPGFFAFADAIGNAPVKPLGVKGQVTGPISTGIGVVDQSGRNIIFDAYAYFDNITLYRPSFINFINRGGVLAWGIVPTLDPDAVDLESTDRLLVKWEDQLAALKNFGLMEKTLLRQTLVASACGAGALTLERARKVLAMTRGVSDWIREKKGLR